MMLRKKLDPEGASLDNLDDDEGSVNVPLGTGDS